MIKLIRFSGNLLFISFGFPAMFYEVYSNKNWFVIDVSFNAYQMKIARRDTF